MKKFAMFFLFAVAVTAFAADKWIEQIQILMTEQEKADYKKLKSDAEKQKFVETLWAKRDPSPGTPENEYKSNFEKNLEQVNTLMKNKRAYESDMGQTLLLLGPPTEQKDEKGPQSAYEEEEEEEAALGKKVWVYKTVPGDASAGEVIVEFRPSAGEWKFADRKKIEPILEKARQRGITSAQTAQAQQPPQQTQAAPTTGTPAVPGAISPEVKEALDATASGTPPTEVPVHALVDSFMTSTGEVFATFAVHSEGAVAGSKVGLRFIDSTGKVVTEKEVPFVDAAASPAEPAGYFQTELPVSAGDHSVAIAVVSNGKKGGIKKSLTVPDHTSKFSMSSIILGKGHQQLNEAKPEKVPYTFGRIKVNPNVPRTFSKSDELIIIYEAYNFKPDSSGQPNIEASIAFQKGTENPKQIPATQAKGLVTGKKLTTPTSFALSEKFFTPGDWKIIVTLTDKTSNQTAKQEAAFTVQ